LESVSVVEPHVHDKEAVADDGREILPGLGSGQERAQIGLFHVEQTLGQNPLTDLVLDEEFFYPAGNLLGGLTFH